MIAIPPVVGFRAQRFHFINGNIVAVIQVEMVDDRHHATIFQDVAAYIVIGRRRYAACLDTLLADGSQEECRSPSMPKNADYRR